MTTIEDIATKYGQTVDAVKAKYEEIYEAEIAEGREPGMADKRAMRIVELSFKKSQMGAPTEELLCIVIGGKEPMDGSENDRKKAMDMFKSNPKKAVAEKWTDANGTPLDRKKDFGEKNGKVMENKNYGKPIKPNWMRILSCFDLNAKEVVTFIVKGDKAVDMPVPFNVPIAINGTSKGDGIWNGTKSTVTRQVPIEQLTEDQKLIVKDLTAGYHKHLKGLFIDLDELEEWVESHGKKDIFMTEADVIQIDMTENSGGSRTVFLDNDTEYGQRVFVPRTVPIIFAEFSRVVMTASAKASKNPEYGPSVTAMGFYPIPEFLVETKETESFDKGINYDNKRDVEDEDDEEEEMRNQENSISGEDVEEEEGEGMPEEPQPEPEKKPKAKGAGKAKGKGDGKLKAATPMLVVKVIGSDGPMSLMQVLVEATDNGYSEASVIEALNQAMAEGEIAKNEDGQYILAEE